MTALALGTCSAVVALTLSSSSAHGAHIAPAVDPPPVGSPPVPVLTLPDRVYAGIPFTVRGDRSRAGDLEISEWEWDLDGDGVFEQTSTSTPWASTTVESGRATIRLRVRSQNGLVASTSGRVRAVAPPSGANLTPLAPTTVQTRTDGTDVDVSWAPPTTRTPVTYRVENLDDPGADPQFVLPADGLTAMFPDLAPGTYRFAVSGVATNGPGPDTTAEAVVRARGDAEPSPSATPTADPTGDTDSTDDPTTDPTGSTDEATSTTGSDRRTGALVLVGVGAALILAAVVGAFIGLRRRRGDEPAAPVAAADAAPGPEPTAPPTSGPGTDPDPKA